MLSLLHQILELDPENKETYLRLGKIFMENQQFSRALELFSRMAAHLPQYYVAHFYLGEAHLLSGNYTAAEQAFLKTIHLEPDLIEPRFKRVEILRRQAEETSYEKMLGIYEEILKIEPDNDRALLETALIYQKTGQKDKAENLFKELGKNAATSSRMVMVAVDTYISQKRYDDAVIVFSELLKADPDNDNLNFFLGMAHESADNPEAAIQHYLNVSSAHPQYKKTLLTIGFLYRKMGQGEKAVAFLEGHHKNNPKDIDIISYLSTFYEQEGHLEKAMDLLTKGLADVPENTSLLFRLGAIQDKAGQKEACIATMKKIIRIDPDDASALNYLGYTYADLGIHLDQAEALIKKALKIKPDDGYITDSMGWVYYKKKEYEKAVFYLEKAATLTEYEAIIASHLADAYVKTGRLSKALAVYHKAIVNAKAEDTDLVQELEAKIKDLEQQLPLPDTRKEQKPEE
jgi:tetratricopeptide (TPR) repeat protein